MKKLKVLLGLCIIFIFLIFPYSIDAYSTTQYSIEVPSTYTQISEGEFSNENGTTIYISSEKYDISEFGSNILETDIYTNDTLNELKKGFEEEMYTYIYSGISSAITSYYPEITDNELENIKKNITYSLVKSEIIEISNYKAFRVKGNINVADAINYILEEYLIYTENYITVIAIGTMDETYFNTTEYSKTLNSFTISDERLPTQISNSMVFDNYIENPMLLVLDLGLTILLYCLVPVILRIKNGKYEYYKGRKIIIINSIVVCFLIILFQSSQNIEITSGATAIFYYYINKAILLKSKEENQSMVEKEVKVNDKIVKEINLSYENEVVIRDRSNSFNVYSEDIRLHNETDKKYCANCGKDIEDSWAFCNHCGFKLK